MSRLLTDPDLLTWEVYATTGPFGLPEKPKYIFNCLSDPGSRPRYAEGEGDVADLQGRILEMSDAELAERLARAKPLG